MRGQRGRPGWPLSTWGVQLGVGRVATQLATCSGMPDGCLAPACRDLDEEVPRRRAVVPRLPFPLPGAAKSGVLCARVWSWGRGQAWRGTLEAAELPR